MARAGGKRASGDGGRAKHYQKLSRLRADSYAKDRRNKQLTANELAVNKLELFVTLIGGDFMINCMNDRLRHAGGACCASYRLAGHFAIGLNRIPSISRRTIYE